MASTSFAPGIKAKVFIPQKNTIRKQRSKRRNKGGRRRSR